MKKRKSKIRQNKSYNKKSKFRRGKSKKKMIGGMMKARHPVVMAPTEEDHNVELSKENKSQNVELSKENERLKTHLADRGAYWTSRLQRYADELKICEEENERLKIQLGQLPMPMQVPMQMPMRMPSHSYGVPRYRDPSYPFASIYEMGGATMPSVVQEQPVLTRELPEVPIELGFTKDEVLRILGNPTTTYATDFNGEIWSYRDTNDLSAKNYQEYYNIRFDKGVVTLYRDNRGRKLGEERTRGPRAAVIVKKLREQRESVQRETAQTTTPSVPHAETTLEYHQRELDRMGTSPTIVSPSTDFIKGDRVYYNNQGEAQLATILRIDRNVPLGEDPYVTLKIDGHEGERQTTIDRIRKVD